MNRKIKILLIVIIVFIAVQFLPASINKSEQADKNNIGKAVVVPAEVDAILKNSCYDCHSNNTNYPWYAKIQPLRLWLDNHVKEGKEELNFDEFESYTRRRQSNKLKSIANTIEEGEMPLSSYTLIHREAKLTDKQKRAILTWVEESRNSLSTE